MKEVVIKGQKYTKEDAEQVLALAEEFMKGNESPEAKRLVENIKKNMEALFGEEE